MRSRNEKTTKQIENEELSRLTDAAAGDDRATTQLDPTQLRALLGGEAPAPIVETPIGTGTLPRANPSPEPPIGTGTLPRVARAAVESTAEVLPIAPRNRWIVPLGAVVLAAAALVAVLMMR
jgi:hypothetical protein